MRLFGGMILGIACMAALACPARAEVSNTASPEFVYHTLIRLFDGETLLMESELPISAFNPARMHAQVDTSDSSADEEQLLRETYIWIGWPAALSEVGISHPRAILASERAQHLSLGGFEYVIFSGRAKRVTIELWRAKADEAPQGVISEDSGEAGSFSVAGPLFDAGHPAWQRLLSYDGLLEMR